MALKRSFGERVNRAPNFSFSFLADAVGWAMSAAKLRCGRAKEHR